MMALATRHLMLLGAVLAIAATATWWIPSAETSDNAFNPADDFCIVAPATPFDPSSGLAIHEPRSVPADARCPVCGMYPARFPHWAAQTIFEDGATQFFDSPVNLLVFLRDPARYSRYAASDIVASFVNDVPHGTWIRADAAFYVHGSSAPGPMREGNLPTFSARESAERFAAERGGVVLTLNEISDLILDALVHEAHRSHAHHH